VTYFGHVIDLYVYAVVSFFFTPFHFVYFFLYQFSCLSIHFMLTNLPPELLIQIIQDLDAIKDKCQLLQTCTQLRQLFCCHSACWNILDFSPYSSLTNSNVLGFLRSNSIQLTTANTAGASFEKTDIKLITELNLSGCWSLSEDMVVALTRSLAELQILQLNGYRRLDEATQELPFEQRDHLYQVRPSHDLSSMAMDLLKKARFGLKLSFRLLEAAIKDLPALTTLSIQYQEINPGGKGLSSFSQFKYIRHIDISSCIISQPNLQLFLRLVGKQLVTLKMLNIELANMTLLCLQQFGTNIECLHFSCMEPRLLPNISIVISHLKRISDFRLTGMRTGSIDNIIYKLNCNTVERLDLSPKLNMFPRHGATPGARQNYPQVRRRSSNSSSGSNGSNSGSNKHPSQEMSPYSHLTGRANRANYTTTEHDLLISDAAIHKLYHYVNLIELRLCFPTASPGAICSLFEPLQSLQIFELRLQSKKRISTSSRLQQKMELTNEEDYLIGLHKLHKLKELHLYSVYLTEPALDSIIQLKSLKYMTVCQAGPLVEYSDVIQHWLNTFPVLNTLRLGHLNSPFSFWFTSTNVIYPSNKENYRDVTFKRLNSRSLWYIF
jgi:hypothetical protein